MKIPFANNKFEPKVLNKIYKMKVGPLCTRHGTAMCSYRAVSKTFYCLIRKKENSHWHNTERPTGIFSGEYESDRRPTRSLVLLPPPPSSGSFFIVTFLLKSAAFQTVRQTFPPSPHIWLSSVCPSVPKSPFNFSQAAYLRFFATIVWAARCSCLAGFGCCPPHHNSHNRE